MLQMKNAETSCFIFEPFLNIHTNMKALDGYAAKVDDVLLVPSG
jgi:hypothetical protein